VEAVERACKARGHEVAIGGELFSDAMGPAGTPTGTYRGMIEHNVRTIVEALR
jgi:manganese/zinc/iron transport system substrate-binding protein